MLGITIRFQATGMTAVGPEGAANLTNLTRQQKGDVAALISEAAGIRQREPKRRPKVGKKKDA